MVLYWTRLRSLRNLDLFKIEGLPFTPIVCCRGQGASFILEQRLQIVKWNFCFLNRRETEQKKDWESTDGLLLLCIKLLLSALCIYISERIKKDRLIAKFGHFGRVGFSCLMREVVQRVFRSLCRRLWPSNLKKEPKLGDSYIEGSLNRSTLRYSQFRGIIAVVLE